MSFTLPRSQRNKYVVVALALIVLIQLLAVAVSGYSARQNSIAVAEDAITRDGNTTIESILRHLDPAEQSVEVTARLLAADLVDTSSPGLERYLYTQLSVMPQMTGAFVGYPDGSFVFVATDGDGFRTKRISMGDERSVIVEYFDASFELTSTETLLDDTYNPAERPWYSLAAASESISWTDPYVFFSSQQPGVTASQAVWVDGEVVAVVGVDVELSGLGEFLDEMSSTETGEAFVVSGDTIVAAPSRYEEQVSIEADGSVRLLSTTELGVPAAEVDARRVVTRVDGEGGAELVLRQTIPADQGIEWDVVVRASEAEFTEIVTGQQRLTLFITLGGGLFVLLALGILWKVSAPINALERAATTDPLTSLANRREISRRGAELLSELRDGERLAVLTLDLDGFKQLNDRFGHHIGDRALVVLAETLQELTRDCDLVGRLGGDEFIVALPTSDVDEGVLGAQRVVVGLQQALELGFPGTDLSVSGGLAVSGDRPRSFTVLIREADSALLAAKSDNRGQLRLADRLVDDGAVVPTS